MTHPSVLPAVAFVPGDNPDWDHARNRRLALRAPYAEWTASSLTEQLPDGFWAPAADFSYEGLLCLVKRENWKFLDRLTFDVRIDGTSQPLEATEIVATPERVAYRYSCGGGELEASYALVDGAADAGNALTVEFAWRGKAPAGAVTLHIKPVLDVRHMYYASDPARHRVNPVDDRHLTVVNNNHWLGLATGRPFEFKPGREQRDVLYRLGRGERHGEDGRVRFRTETFKGFVPGELRFEFDGPIRLDWLAGEGEAAVLAALETLAGVRQTLLDRQEERLASYHEKFPKLPSEVVQRIYVMAEKFAMPVDAKEGESGTAARLPAAGGWWFRTPWFRNVFEGYLHNHRTLAVLGKSQEIGESIRLALKYQEPGSGRLPNRLPEVQADHERWELTGSLPADYYVASDAITLLYTLVDETLAELESDEALVLEIWNGFKRAFASFKSSRLTQRNGRPVLLENGLLLVVPSHSWINGKRVVWAEGMTVTDLPIRCPINWQLQDILHFRDSHYAWEQYQYPTYYLPEINAQWLRMLEVGRTLARRFGDQDLTAELEQIHGLARSSYKGIFWNPHANFLYNLITLDRRIDGTPTSPAVEAAALLGERVFTRLELEQVWQMTRNRLLVKRKLGDEMKPFGLIVKDSSERIFYDNQQYHEAVVWPRETPYLVRLLKHLGQEATVRDLLLTNLGHQQEEAVLFYNNEMLGLPDGVNPSPNEETATNPVPVKNPMQWWSQFCDVYLDGPL